MRRLGRFIWLIITMLLVTVATTFATSNKALITLYLWPFDGAVTAPAWLVVMSSFILGGLLSLFLMCAQTLAIRARLWNLQGKFNRLEVKTAQKQSAANTSSDEQSKGFSASNYAPTHSIKDQEPKTF